MTWYEASTFFAVFATASLLVLQSLITWLGGRDKLGYHLLTSEVVIAPSKDIDIEYPCTTPSDHYVAGLKVCESRKTRAEKLACYDQCRQTSQAMRGGLYPNLDRRVNGLATQTDGVFGLGSTLPGY
jgi:hypothetical protein